jgi:hypothetical protein
LAERSRFQRIHTSCWYQHVVIHACNWKRSIASTSKPVPLCRSPLPRRKDPALTTNACATSRPTASPAVFGTQRPSASNATCVTCAYHNTVTDILSRSAPPHRGTGSQSSVATVSSSSWRRRTERDALCGGKVNITQPCPHTHMRLCTCIYAPTLTYARHTVRVEFIGPQATDSTRHHANTEITFGFAALSWYICDSCHIGRHKYLWAESLNMTIQSLRQIHDGKARMTHKRTRVLHSTQLLGCNRTTVLFSQM